MQAAPRPIEPESTNRGAGADLLAAGDDMARATCVAQIVSRQQRRASRIACTTCEMSQRRTKRAGRVRQGLQHIKSVSAQPFVRVWLTRILINGCLDRQKARCDGRAGLLPVADAGRRDRSRSSAPHDERRSPEAQLMAREWREQLVAAVNKLPDRQRLVFMLCHYSDHSTRDVAAMTGLNESTVRVHLFRAIRKLRTAMEGQRHAI